MGGQPSSRGKSHDSKETIDEFLREGDHRYHNPDPLYRLIGPANETETIIEGVKLTTLIESGAQCLSITLEMVQKLGLELKGLDKLHLRGWGGDEVGYLGYTKCTLEVLEVAGIREDVLLLVVKNTDYGDQVPILLGTLHIDMILEKVMLEELKTLPAAW